MYKVLLSKKALKDIKNLKSAGLSDKARLLIDLLKINPYTTPPSYEKLVGDLDGMYSRRINIQHRLVYTVNEQEHIVKVLRMWTHYE
ncbi:RelE/StbE replicon stabilization toxin [Petrocella atlantisensis]|uniref:Endoribonuclease YoeB n=1 Tax=Petrocella atlantisensis TaxID=2173034 RepID=A0A3P7S6R2_9FIRM|nr:Txe/YoeB family addiction module toxin [Petrocella atlantisensis]VDN47959.1 RelE/StbE replicon stabilization toxin [Petrocella atlantisensis]